ncbi:hypothetical protein C4D60_Mb01t25140 [Musa balbisiana]|uniref:Uncharacterized protein n=1 Tax=Musa balbisiana TaxID=52838 RepID=A0A4S8JQP0_MUSBA|nr:hypothetical protein C4D60_Mb01t25140 [Musa balbisiana]
MSFFTKTSVFLVASSIIYIVNKNKNNSFISYRCICPSSLTRTVLDKRMSKWEKVSRISIQAASESGRTTEQEVGKHETRKGLEEAQF